MATDTSNITTPSGPTPQRSRRRRPVALTILGWLLASTWCFAFLAFGGVHPGSRAVLHGLLAGCLVAAIALPDHVLKHCGRVWPVFGAGVLMLVAVCAGFLPIPAAIAPLIAPGLSDRIPSFMITSSSLDPEATVDAATHVLLVLAAATALACWGLAAWRRGPVEWAILLAGVALPAVALAHAWTHTTALFGVIPTWIQAPYPFFAPFISRNHAGSAILLAVPLLVAGALEREKARSSRVGYALVLALVAIALLQYRATAPITIAGAQVLLVAVQRKRLPALAVVALGAVGLALAVLWDQRMDDGDMVALHGRAELWTAASRLFSQHWLLGAGAGTFAETVGPYRTDVDWVVWDHAHQEYLEWLAVTGVVGALCAGLAAWLVFPRALRDGDRAFVLYAGAGGVLAHGLVDFPLQVPALAMSAAGLLALVGTLYRERRGTQPATLRVALGGLVLVNVLAAGWQARNSVVDPASQALWAGARERASAVATLHRWAPWRAEVALDDARTALRQGREQDARDLARSIPTRFPHDPRALRSAALLLVDLDEPELARSAVDRAVSEGPWDWTNHLARARVLTRLTPDEAPAAWRAALASGAPSSVFREAWAVVPVGLYWVDSVTDRTPRQAAALAAFLSQMGDLEAAGLAYEQAMLEHPDELFPGYVEILLRTGQLDAADLYVERALVVQPEDPTWSRRLAMVRERQGRDEEAAEAWLVSARTRPVDVANAARALDRARGGEAALALLRRLELGGARLDPQVVIERARIHARLGMYAECIEGLHASGILSEKPPPAARDALAACTSRTPPKEAPPADDPSQGTPGGRPQR